MARGYGFTPSASYLQQQQASQNRYAAPKASAPTAPTQQPASTPSQPWNPNLARILWARSGVADPVNAWRNNPYQGGLAPTMPSVPRPGRRQPVDPGVADQRRQEAELEAWQRGGYDAVNRQTPAYVDYGPGNPGVQKPQYGTWIGKPDGERRIRDFRDSDGDGIDDRTQAGPGQRPPNMPAPRPGTAQPVQPPSLGTPYSPGQPTVGGWPDYGTPNNRGLDIAQDRQRALQDSRSRMPIQLRAPSEGSASPQPPVQSPAPSLGSFGQGMPQDPMTQMWQQSMNAWAMPKQQLMQWGQQVSQMPWGPNYANSPDGRPDPYSIGVQGAFGNNVQDMWNNMGGFIQGVNNQAMQKPVGVYQGQGNPGAQYGKVNYDIRSLINQGNQMVQNGWQNPFMQGGAAQPQWNTPSWMLQTGPGSLGYLQ